MNAGDSSPEPARGLHRLCPQCDLEITDDRTDKTCPSCGTKLIELRGSNDDLIGTVIDGRFEIRSLLGQGGMGSVYRAWQRSVGREVAIKLIDRGFARDTMAVKRFWREAKLASQLSQPNTVSVFDFGQADDGRLFIAMELIKGRTLHAVLLADGKFSIARTVRMGTQICDALEAAHSLGIMHRDMKLENLIILDHPPGRDLLKVLDFGLAKTLDDNQSRGTQSGVVVGTPRYMSPEAAMSGTALPAGDLYAVGVILAELVLGQALWPELSLPALVAQKLDPSAVVAQIPLPLREVIGRLLDPEPDSRPTASHARALLTAVLETPSAPALPAVRATTGASTLELDPLSGDAPVATPAPARASPFAGSAPTAVADATPAPAAARLPSVNEIAYAATSASGSERAAALRVSVSTPPAAAAPPSATPRPIAAAASAASIQPGTGVTLMSSTGQSTVEARTRRGGLLVGLGVAVAAVVVVAIAMSSRGHHARDAAAAPSPPASDPSSAPIAAPTQPPAARPTTPDPAAAPTLATVERTAPTPGGAIGSAAPTAAQVTLHVHSKPEGAMIVVDQKPLGVAPIDVPLARGSHAVAIVARLGGRTVTQHVVPDHERDVELALPTARPGASAAATASPGGAAKPAGAAGSDDQVPF